MRVVVELLYERVRRVRLRVVLGMGVLLLYLPVSLVAAPGLSAAATSNRVALKAAVPAPVASGSATAVGSHNPAASLRLDVGLRVRHSAALDRLIAAGGKLTPAQYSANNAPTRAEASALSAWLNSQGLTVLGTVQDDLWVRVQGSTARVARAFGVSVNDYRAAGRTFYAPSRAPVVPASLNVSGITGLDDYVLTQAGVSRPRTSAKTNGAATAANLSAPYCPSVFSRAYDVQNGAAGQSIGMVLWGAPLVQSDLDAFTSKCGTRSLSLGTGSDHVQFVAVDGTTNDTSMWGETALDVENGHAIAPGSQLTYYLADARSGVDDAENEAVHDSALQVISNSWGISACVGCGSDGSDADLDATLQYGASVGKTILFSTGDDAKIHYPSTSPDVVAVGGTSLSTDDNGNWSGESAWSSGGNGCSATWGRPPWQTGVGAATCSGRAEPDVSADADLSTGAWDCSNGGCAEHGGTSLAAPLWAGMIADWNAALAAKGQPGVGFAAPLLYTIAQNPASACSGSFFHDSMTSSPSNTIEHWPGGQLTYGAAPCTVTVARPSGDIDLIGGTAGVDSYRIAGFTGFSNVGISVETPDCEGTSSFGSVNDNRPTCSNASTVFESNHSSDTADIVAGAGRGFRDITSGCQSSHCAGSGWDETTGWGSPDLADLIALTPSAQTIAFAALGGHSVGSSPFTVAPTASSGLPVTVTSNSPSVCTVGDNSPSTGWTVTSWAVGTCSLTATQTGNSGWRDASPVTRTFSVTGPNLVQGGFESPAGAEVYMVPSKIGKWSVTAGSVDIVTNAYAAAGGAQSLDLNGVGAGTIQQPIALPAAGNYKIRFYLAGNPLCRPRTLRVNLLWNGSLAHSYAFNTAGHSGSSPGWVVKALTVSSGPGTATLAFASASGGTCGPALDAVSVKQVP